MQHSSDTERSVCVQGQANHEGCSPAVFTRVQVTWEIDLPLLALPFALPCPTSRPKSRSELEPNQLNQPDCQPFKHIGIRHTASRDRVDVEQSTWPTRASTHRSSSIGHRSSRRTSILALPGGQAGLTLPRRGPGSQLADRQRETISAGAHQARPPCCSTIHRPRSMIHRLLS